MYVILFFFQFVDKTGYHPSRERGLGTDLAIFTSAYSMSQIIGALLVSLLLTFFKTIGVAMWCAAGSAFLGTVVAIFVVYLETDDVVHHLDSDFSLTDKWDEEDFKKKFSTESERMEMERKLSSVKLAAANEASPSPRAEMDVDKNVTNKANKSEPNETGPTEGKGGEI
jgi:hypothetical protein